MTYGAFTQDFASQDFASFQLVKPSRRPIPQAALCAVALALSTSVGLWALYARPVPTSQTVELAQNAPTPAPAAAPAQVAHSAKVAVPLRAAKAVVSSAKVSAAKASSDKTSSDKAEAKLDPSFFYPFATFAPAKKVASNAEPRVPQLASVAAPAAVAAVVPTAPLAVVASVAPTTVDVPLPLPRPATLAAPRDKTPASVPARPIIQAKVDPTETPAAPRAPETFFDKMFNAARPSGTALAYAAPEDGGMGGIFGGSRRPAGGYDRQTAIYDITAHTVYLPDGTRLEAHSGLGPYKDNPASVAMRMVGVTPPNLYDLTFREAPFHGVRALRLTPTGGTTYGRAGLLAHTYMLRGRIGESNGCVVFKDYQAFLRAFESGQIRRLAVVVRMS